MKNGNGMNDVIFSVVEKRVWGEKKIYENEKESEKKKFVMNGMEEYS